MSDNLRGSVLVTCAFAAALLVAPAVGGLIHGVRPVAAVLLVSALSMVTGLAVVPLLRLPSRVPVHVVAAIVGYIGASIVHLAATALLNLPAHLALVLDIVVAAAAARVTWRRTAGGPMPDTVGPWRPVTEAGLLLACAALATLWARETVTAVPSAASTGIFPAWQDYFLHAAEVSYLRDYPAFEGHSQYLTAVAQPLYHRGSYALPALLSAVSDMPSLGLATAFWLPTGLFLSLCATVVFGTALGGPLAGLGAVVAVYLVPDASAYGFENRFLSFHWLSQMAAGSGYALALVLVALTVVVTSAPERRTRAVVTAGLLVAAAAAFRVHVSMLAAGTLGWLVVLAWRPRVTAAGIGWLLAAVAAVAAAVWWMESIALAPHFLSGLSHPVLFFLSIHTQASNQASPYVGWTEHHGDVWKVSVGFAMMIVAGLGASLAVLLAAWPSRVFTRMGWRVGAIPIALLLSSLSVILLVPTPAHGDITDFGHRPFVLVYLVCGAVAGAAMARLLGEWSMRRRRSAASAWVAVGLLALVGLAAPWKYGARVQQRWWPPYARVFVSRDALGAGAFVRAHSAPGEEVLAASEDPFAVYVALSERRAYVSRTSLYRLLGGEFAAAAGARADAHASVAMPTSYEQLQAFGAVTGVAWYIADTRATQQWPEAVTARCAYCSDSVRVYDLR